MTRRFLFTGGTSVLGPKGLRAERGKELKLQTGGDEQPTWLERLTDWEHDPASVSPQAATAFDPRLTDLLGEVLDESDTIRRFGVECRQAANDEPRKAAFHLRKLGAEGESIARRQASAEPQWRLGPDDEIVLLATDTAAGVVAAVMTVLLSDRWPVLQLVTADAVSVQDITHGAPVSRRPTGIICVVQGMSAGSPQGIEGSSAALTTALRRTAATHEQDVSQPEQLIVEFSGGYKAAIPFLLHLLEYLQSIPSDRLVASLSLWFRHENEPDRWLRAPLRRLDPAALYEHWLELDDVAHGGCPSTETLKGFGWFPDTGLTSIGRGALTLLREHGYQH